MNKNILIVCVLLVCIVAQNQNIQQPSETNVIILDNTNLLTSIYQSEEPWLLDLYAPWCGHCMKMTSEWEKLATKMKGTLKVAKIDAAKFPQFNDLYDLKGFPHIVFIPGGKKDKSVYYPHVGPRTAEGFEHWTLRKIDEHKRSFLERLTDEQKWQQICLGTHSDFCTIFFLPSIKSSSEEQRDFYLKTINGLIKKFSRSPVSWLWTESGDHKGLEKQFGLDSSFPKVVLINPTGKRFSVMQKSLTEDDFTEWMKNVWDIEFKSIEGELAFGDTIPETQAIQDVKQWKQL